MILPEKRGMGKTGFFRGRLIQIAAIPECTKNHKKCYNMKQGLENVPCSPFRIVNSPAFKTFLVFLHLKLKEAVVESPFFNRCFLLNRAA